MFLLVSLFFFTVFTLLVGCYFFIVHHTRSEIHFCSDGEMSSWLWDIGAMHESYEPLYLDNNFSDIRKQIVVCACSSLVSFIRLNNANEMRRCLQNIIIHLKHLDWWQHSASPRVMRQRLIYSSFKPSFVRSFIRILIVCVFLIEVALRANALNSVFKQKKQKLGNSSHMLGLYGARDYSSKTQSSDKKALSDFYHHHHRVPPSLALLLPFVIVVDDVGLRTQQHHHT